MPTPYRSNCTKFWNETSYEEEMSEVVYSLPVIAHDHSSLVLPTVWHFPGMSKVLSAEGGEKRMQLHPP